MTELHGKSDTLVARPLTVEESESAVRVVLRLGEFADPADTYTVLEACGLLDTAHDMHARRTP